MGTCRHCGGEIEFRWMNGSLRPLHVSGGCSASIVSDGLDHIRTSYNQVESYLNPNARCPKCNKPVYFYRSPHNGRVFFDDVGWPWPKHGCFISQDIRDDQISATARGTYRFHFRDRDGGSLDVWRLDGPPKVYADGFIIKLIQKERGARLSTFISTAQLAKHAIGIPDLEDAPSIIIPKHQTYPDQVSLSFLCARIEAVISLIVNVQAQTSGAKFKDRTV